MKSNWQTKKLGDIIKLEYGKPLPDSKRKPDGAYPAYGANGEKSRTNEYYHDKTSIIIGRKGSAGEINFTEKKFWPLDVTYFVTFDDTKYDLKFIYYLLISLDLPKLAKGVKPGINRNDIYEIEVRIPSLCEQQRIVTILDKAFAAIEKVKEKSEKNMKNSKYLFESYLHNVFSAPSKNRLSKRLVDVCTFKPSKKEARDRLDSDDFVSFVPMEDLGISTKEFIATKVRKLKDVSGSYSYFSDNDILLAKITPCFENGKIGIARNLKNAIGFGSSEYIVFRPKSELMPDYLYYFLARENFRQEGEKSMTGAVGHKRVSMEFIKNLEIPYPKSIDEQLSIIADLDALNAESKKLQIAYRKKAITFDALKKSILQKAFTGELLDPASQIDKKVSA